MRKINKYFLAFIKELKREWNYILQEIDDEEDNSEEIMGNYIEHQFDNSRRKHLP